MDKIKANYRLGVYEKAFPKEFTLDEILKLAKEVGFDYVEMSIDETDERLERLDWRIEQIKELKNSMVSNNIRFETICLSAHRRFPLGSIDPTIRKKALEIMKKAALLAKELDIKLIQLAGYDVYYETSSDKTKALFEENLKIAVEYAAENGIKLGFETMETPFMDTISKAMHYVKKIDSPYLGIYPDIGNLQNAIVKYKLNLIEELNSGVGHIFAAHLKETKPGVYRDMDFGDGHTEYKVCLNELRKQGVSRFTAEFWFDKDQHLETRLRKSFLFLKDKLDT